jgi:hypothetical protein
MIANLDKSMTPDEVCEFFSKKKIKLSMKLLSEGENDIDPMILVLGDSNSLKMLAAFILAIAEGPDDDGVSISPHGAGNSFFDKKSEFGIYIEKISKKNLRK